MAKQETDNVHLIQLNTVTGARLWKNVRGLFYTKDGVKGLLDAIRSANWKSVIEAVKNLRQVKAGLQAEDSSDLIGFTPLLITPEMVGKTVAIFTAIEVKSATGRVELGQTQFTNFIVKNGGYAGIARSPEDAKKIMQNNI